MAAVPSAGPPSTADVLAQVAQGLALPSGPDFYATLVAQMAQAVGADAAFVAELLSGGGGRARTRAAWLDGAAAADFELGLAGTPDADVIRQGLSVYPARVQAVFPLDERLRTLAAEGYVGAPLLGADGRTLGLVAAAFRRPIEDVGLVRSLAQIFAARAGLELDREQADESRVASERRYRSYINASPVGIVLFDEAERIVDANAAVCRMCGLTHEELGERRLTDLVLPEARILARRHVAAMRASGRAADDLVAETSAGRRQWRLESVRLEEGYGLSFWVDLTDHRHLEEQLRQAHKMEAVGRLAGGVAHDFNNTLTVVGGHATLLERHVSQSPEALAHLEEIRKAVERAARLTHQLLAFGRREAVNRRPLGLNDVVRGVEPLLRRLIGEDIRLETTCEPRLHAVLADEGQIQHVLMQLAANARDAMPGGGTLALETSNASAEVAGAGGAADLAPGEYAVLSVRDSGRGMEAEILEHVFEPFFTTKERGAGAGMGLATVYAIVRQSGGVTRVESEPGRGTVVRVYLPRSERDLPAVTRGPASTEGLQGDEVVLLVEDQAAVAQLARRALEAYGYRVLAAGSAEEAVERLEREKVAVDVLVTDVVLPGLSGPELGTQLRRLRPTLAVVLTSGYDDDFAARHAALPEGAVWLAKPFSPADLAAAVRQSLKGRVRSAGPATVKDE